MIIFYGKGHKLTHYVTFVYYGYLTDRLKTKTHSALNKESDEETLKVSGKLFQSDGPL